VSALEAVAAEAANQGPIRIQLGDDPKNTVLVLPTGKWRASAFEDIAAGRYGDWARKCSDAKGHQTWLDVDPTIDEVKQFFADWKEESGQDVGESSASSGSSKTTRKK
jgi:hypothetical protein